MKTDYNFPVEFRAIVTEPGNLAIPNKQAVVRTDTKFPIGVVSKKYALVPHAEVVDTFRKALKGQTIEEKIKLTHNGARMHFKITMPDVLVKVDSGDEVAMQLIVENSYDGSHRLQVIFGAFRLVCSNGMIIGQKFLSIDRRHIGQVSLDIEQVQKQVGMLTELFKDSGKTMKKMNETKLAPSPKEFFDPKRLHIPSYVTKLALQAYGDGETVWDAYNALTSVITRGMKKESPEASITLGKKAWSAATALVK